MRQFSFLVSVLAIFTCVAVAVEQPKPNAEQAEKVESPAAVIVNLFEARYPPLALTANVFGDVHLKLGIRKDGSVESAFVLSGQVPSRTAYHVVRIVGVLDDSAFRRLRALAFRPQLFSQRTTSVRHIRCRQVPYAPRNPSPDFKILTFSPDIP